MASESTEGETVSVVLPSELHGWLEEQAAELDVDRDQLVAQLVASYRTTAEFEESLPETLAGDDLAIPAEQLAEAVDEQLSDTVDEQVEERVHEQVTAAVEEEVAAQLDADSDEEPLAAVRAAVKADLEAELDDRIESTVRSVLADTLEDQLGTTVQETAEPLVTERVNEATTAVQRQLGDRIDATEKEFQTKLEDVRERVIQVKKEADAKAPKDHTHGALEGLADLEAELATMEEELGELRVELEETVPKHSERIDGLADRLGEVEDRLQTVAWVVSDLREAHQSGNGLEAVERIKRAAAKADIERAKCENCGGGVTLSLLTDPECPHCSATVTNVEPDPGWFRKPKLRVASQLESGDSE